MAEADRQRRALVTLILVVAGQMLVSGLFAAVFAARFPPLGRRFQLFHVSLVAAILCAIALGAGLLARYERARTGWLRRLMSGSFGMASALLMLLYAANIASNSLWRENIHLGMLPSYGRWSLGLVPQSTPFSPGTYVLVFGGVAAMTGLFVLLSDTLFRAVEALVLPGGRHSLFRSAARTRRTVIAGSMLVVALGIELAVLSRSLIAADVLHRDPIVAFFRPEAERGKFGWYLGFERQQRAVAAERAAYRQISQTATRNVIIIIVDSLRADHLPLYGYARETTPFLSRLAREGKLRKVALALSGCALTPCGILSTMSGKYVPAIQADFKIFDLLHDLGYSSYFILSGRHEEEGLHLAYGTEQALYLDGDLTGRYGAQDDRNILEGLDRLPRNADDKAFVYIHLMSAHWAGIKWPEYAHFSPNDARIGLGTMFRGTTEREKWINRYDNGVLQADAVIERVFAKLAAAGYLDRSTVMILGDHGEALGEHGPTSYFHGDILYQEAVHIPLLIYDDPAVEYHNLAFASQIDVAPTIVDRLQLASPSSWRGQSLLRPAADRAITIGDPRCGAVVSRHGERTDKYVRCASTSTEALFELSRDPHETENLIERADPERLHALRVALDRSAQ